MKHICIATDNGRGLFVERGEFLSASPMEFTEIVAKFCKVSNSQAVGFDKVAMEQIAEFLTERNADGLLLRICTDNNLMISLIENKVPTAVILRFEGDNYPSLYHYEEVFKS